MATRSNPFEKQPEMPPITSSGDLRSRLDRVLPKDVRISEDRRWAKDLLREIPFDLVEKATDFIETSPADVSKEDLARELLNIIRRKPQGILRASDPEIALQDCITEAKNRYLMN